MRARNGLRGVACALLCFLLLAPSDAQAVETNQIARLAKDVAFLAQPKLKGRKSGTAGSRMARYYIERQFKECGLIPWKGAHSYELPFRMGVNVAGVLPGADPILKEEIVIVSAHYDHLGKAGKHVYAGAADNASGVAALLAVAREMAAENPRPKRSVAFVAFDCEEMMLLGSFAFSCRPNVETAKIAAVVNADMLGRDLLDAVHQTVFVAGTEGYPGLGEQIRTFGANAGIRVLPLGTDLIGPRSDHVAFESLGVPCVFFSCGTFKDYHQPTDTPDKLNYADLAASTEVMLRTAKELASARTAAPAASDIGYKQELLSVCAILPEIAARSEQAGIDADDVEAFKKLAAKAEQLSKTGRYDEDARQQLIVEAAGLLVPYMMPGEAQGHGETYEQEQYFKLTMQYLQEFYLNYHSQIMDGYRKLVAHLLKYRPGPFHGMPDFRYEIYDVRDGDILVQEKEDGVLQLDALVNEWNFASGTRTSKWLIKNFSLHIGAEFVSFDCKGTKEDLADYCLLHLRREQTNATRSATIRKIMTAIAGKEVTESYSGLLQKRLATGGFNRETDWLAHCALSSSADVSLAALQSKVHDPAVERAACQVMVDSSRRADTRAVAMHLITASRNKKGLLEMCHLLADSQSAYKPEFTMLFNKEYPFADRLGVKTILPVLEKQSKRFPDASKSLGDVAYGQLKKATKKDFGKDSARWVECIRKL